MTTFFVDGHVHVHPFFDYERFLETAYRNLSAFGDGIPTLLLSETKGRNVFEEWRSGGCPWSIETTDQDAALFLERKLLLIAGRQVVSQEGVEVLTLFCGDEINDGIPLSDTIDAACASDAIPVLPWGVGKWMGRRGRLVAEALQSHAPYLGDNAGRPPFWPTPKIFQNAVVLPGTDPLKLPPHERRAGSYGFALETPSNAVGDPASQLRHALESLKSSPQPIGRRASLWDSVADQVRLRFK